VYSSVGIELDFTHETLPLLDHYLVGARAEMPSRPEALPLLAESMGAYFGHVVANHLTGFWRAQSADPHSWLLCMQPVFLAINPVAVGYDVLTQGGRHGGPASEFLLAKADRVFVEARLAALPEEHPDDYYTFSTRFDALYIVSEALRGQMADDGHLDVSFESSDYADEFGDGF
jgi:hypothetical protein